MRPAHATTVRVTVPFHDCDPLGIVWHGRYFEYLEAARTALLQSFRLDVPDVRGLGFKMFVADARCRYLFPLAYGEVAAVTAWLSELGPLLRVAYDIDNETRGRKSARAYTVIALTDHDNQLLKRVPDDIMERFSR